MGDMVEFENNGLFRKRSVLIGDGAIAYAGVSIAVADATEMHHGVMVHYHNGIKASTSSRVIISDGEKKLKIAMEDVFYFTKKTKRFQEMMQVICPLVCPVILRRILGLINDGGQYQIGKVVFRERAIALRRHGLLRAGDYVDVPPDQIEIAVENGCYTVRSRADKAVRESIAIRETANSWAVPDLWRLLVQANAAGAGPDAG